MSEFKKYTNVFDGSTFPDKPYKKVKVSFSQEILSEYIPAIDVLGYNKGLKLLMIIMAEREGFTKKSRSYRTNNPGNVGNNDRGDNKVLETLADGIRAQAFYINKVVQGKHRAYPMGKLMKIPPFFSAEIDKNKVVYGMSGYLPGYHFIFTGQLDQFIKIYSTGARAGNNYLNAIVSFFHNHGYKEITPASRLQDIIELN